MDAHDYISDLIMFLMLMLSLCGDILPWLLESACFSQVIFASLADQFTEVSSPCATDLQPVKFCHFSVTVDCPYNPEPLSFFNENVM